MYFILWNFLNDLSFSCYSIVYEILMGLDYINTATVLFLLAAIVYEISN